MLDGTSEHVSILDCTRSNQMPYTDQITEIATDVLTYFWVKI